MSAGGQNLLASISAVRVADLGRRRAATNTPSPPDVNHHFGWSDLTSVSGFFWRRDDRNIDGTVYDSQYIGSSLQQQFGYGGAAISALAAPVQFNTGVNQFHEELRLASKPQGPDDKWAWIGGLYYSKTRTSLLDNEHIPGFNSTFESTYGATPLDVLAPRFPMISCITH